MARPLIHDDAGPAAPTDSTASASSDPGSNVAMPADLYERFQRHLFETGRRKKGAISEAICEAVEAWLRGEEQEPQN